jgi:hypothetical protein
VSVHPLDGHLRLSRLLDALPRTIERGDTPPYIHTLALLESLRHLGFQATLWNAKLESKHKIIIVAGVCMNDEILDWHGQDPRHYPLIYPILQHGKFSSIQSEDLIPGKRAIALKALPMLIEMVNETVEYLFLIHSTQDAGNEGAARRL